MGSAAADPRAARELKRCWRSLLLIIVFFLSFFLTSLRSTTFFCSVLLVRNSQPRGRERADCGCAFFVFDCLIIVKSSFSILPPSTINSFRQAHTEYIAVIRSFAVAQPWKTWRVDIRCWRSWGVSVFPGVFGRVGLQEADVVIRWELWNCIQSH